MHEITCEQLKESLGQYKLIDVRNPEEYVGELGHIPGALLVTLGPDVMSFLERESHDQPIVFICRSGARSAQTTLLSEELGFTKTYNLVGGMLRWNELGYQTTQGEKS
ncbi:putative adenylyltransferase/sulfurtransferase MoeZ [compost metagenome]